MLCLGAKVGTTGCCRDLFVEIVETNLWAPADAVANVATRAGVGGWSTLQDWGRRSRCSSPARPAMTQGDEAFKTHQDHPG